MRSLAGGMSSRTDWDLPVADDTANKFKVSAGKLKAVRHIGFSRSLFPSNKISRPRLVTFPEGKAYCCLVYVLRRTKDQAFTVLVVGMAKVMSQKSVCTQDEDTGQPDELQVSSQSEEIPTMGF